MEFVKTEILSQINWDKEIANETPVNRIAQTVRAKKALFVWMYIQDYFIKDFSTKAEHEKSNSLRILQYFYGKFIYHHSLVYKDYHKTLDITESLDGKRDINKLSVIMKEYGELPKSKLPLKDIKKLESVFKQLVIKEEKRREQKRKENDGGYSEAKKLFEDLGLKVVKPKGIGKEHDRDTVCVVHDSVRYHLVLMKNRDFDPRDRKKDSISEYNDHQIVLKHYHPLVKELYNKIKLLPDIGDVWAMEGGGAQMQIFFGNKKGYLGILYLNMKKDRNPKGPYSLRLENGAKGRTKEFKELQVEGIKIEE